MVSQPSRTSVRMGRLAIMASHMQAVHFLIARGIIEQSPLEPTSPRWVGEIITFAHARLARPPIAELMALEVMIILVLDRWPVAFPVANAVAKL